MKNWRISNEHRRTEKKYWVNGIQVRGRDFYTLNVSIKKFAFMLSFSWSCKYISFNSYKLI